MGQKRHAIHWPHGDVQRTSYIHRHGGRYCDWVGNIHGRRGRDVDRGDVDGPGDGDRVLEADWRRDVDRVGANVHLCGYGDRVVVVVVVVVTTVHCCGNGGRNGHRGSRGRVADFVSLFVTGVKVSLPMSLQMAGDVRRAEHLTTDATGDLAFMPDHVGTQSVFGGKSRGTGRHLTFKWSF